MDLLNTRQIISDPLPILGQGFLPRAQMAKDRESCSAAAAASHSGGPRGGEMRGGWNGGNEQMSGRSEIRFSASLAAPILSISYFHSLAGYAALPTVAEKT